MMRPLEEIRVAGDAMELILNLRTKHPGLQWAVEACEHKYDFWRVLIVIRLGFGPTRVELYIEDTSTPGMIADKVNQLLSKF